MPGNCLDGLGLYSRTQSKRDAMPADGIADSPVIRSSCLETSERRSSPVLEAYGAAQQVSSNEVGSRTLRARSVLRGAVTPDRKRSRGIIASRRGFRSSLNPDYHSSMRPRCNTLVIPCGLIACTTLFLLLPAARAEVVQSGLGRSSIAAETTGNRIVLHQGNRRRTVVLDPLFDVSGVAVNAIDGRSGRWLLVGTEDQSDGSRNLLLLVGDRKRQTRLALPPDLDATERASPVLFGGVDDYDAGRSWGVAWLEGTNSTNFEVRAASWNGARFDTPKVVSPRAEGSQLAPSSAVLADGSWLLLWSAFVDGDTTILWSQRLGETWSTPERVGPANRVPDITPTVIATRTGALAAWSTFDGGIYHVVVARFEDGAWSEPRRVFNGSGLYPELLAEPAGQPLLLCYQASTQQWHLFELDAHDLRVVRRASVATPSSFPPLVRAVGASGVSLRWTAETLGGKEGLDTTVQWVHGLIGRRVPQELLP